MWTFTRGTIPTYLMLSDDDFEQIGGSDAPDNEKTLGSVNRSIVLYIMFSIQIQLKLLITRIFRAFGGTYYKSVFL